MLISNILNAQIDDNSRDMLLKLTLFSESLDAEESIDSTFLNNFMKIKLETNILKQSGFKHFEFYSIKPIVDIKNAKSSMLPIIMANCNEYIVAINKGSFKVYRLKGFYANDFSSFLRTLKDMNYKNLNRRSKIEFWYSVENLDIGCLYEAYKSNSFDFKEYPCLHYCSEFVTTH